MRPLRLVELSVMSYWLLKPIRQFVDALVANDSPRQVAIGCTIGMVLGLVPKGNLIALALGVLLCALRVNRSAGLAFAAFFSLLSPQLDSITHVIGNKLLREPALQSTWANLYDMPLGPWIGFDNTVVLGALVLGLYISYPCYWMTLVAWQKFQVPLARWIARYRVSRWLTGMSLATRVGG